MSSLDLVFVYQQRECLRLSIPTFLSMSLAEMASAAKWVSQRMREKMEVQVLHYTDYEGDVIATDHPSAEAFLVLMCDCKQSQQLAVIFDCSIEPRNLTWERRNYRPSVPEKSVSVSPILANEEHFLKTLQKLEKQQQLIKETAQRTLAQQRSILRSYEMKDMTGRRRSPSPPNVAPVSESLMTMDTFHKMMLEDVKKESPKRNPSAREVDLIDFMNQLETELLQAELNCNLLKIDRSVSSAMAFEKPTESMSTTTLSISEPVTHSVCERAHVARETQTEEKEEKSQETSTFESGPLSDKLVFEMTRLFINEKRKQQSKHGHKIDRSVSSVIAFEKPTESMSTTTLSISEPVTHSVCERAHAGRETQTEEKEEKSQETSTFESGPLSDKLVFQVACLLINEKRKQESKHSHKDKSSKSGNKREKSPMSAITKKSKKEMVKMKTFGNRPLTGILKEYPLKKIGILKNKEIFTKDFKMVNVTKGILENVQVRMISSTPDVVEMVSGEPSITIENGKSVRVTVGVACDARRAQPSYASFVLHTSSGIIWSPNMHIYLNANNIPHQLSVSPGTSTLDQFLANAIIVPTGKVLEINTSSTEISKTADMVTKVTAETFDANSESSVAPPPVIKAKEVNVSTKEAVSIPLGQEVFEEVVEDNEIHNFIEDLVKRLSASCNKISGEASSSEIRIEGGVFENIVDDNVQLIYTATSVESVQMNVKAAAVKSNINDSNEEQIGIENAEDEWDHYEDAKEYALGSDYELGFDDEGSDFEIIPSSSTIVSYEK